MLGIILAGFLSYFGIILGIWLSYIAPEELIPGKRYFRFAKRAVFILICLTIILSLIGMRPITIVIIVFIMIALALTRHINTSKIYYAISAALLGISATIDKTSFFYLCVLVVLYGMLMATVHLEGFTRNEKITLRKSIVLKRMLLSNLYHPLVFLVFFFVSSTI